MKTLSEQPIFFIGMPRSGTTVVFESFARIPDLGWLSNYSEMWPSWPVANTLCLLLDNRLLNMRGNKKQYGKVVFGNRYLPQPVEAYNFWDKFTGRNFSRSYLTGEKADGKEVKTVRAAVDKVLRYQMKSQLVTKLTGPGRITYLSSIFPEAKFIHVVRDGRAVVHSLMNVGFWKDKGGFDQPFWEGGLSDEDINMWHDAGKSPEVLCAIQWLRIMQNIHNEQQQIPDENIIVVKYEDYIANPKSELKRLSDATSCGYEERTIGFIGDGTSIVNMNTKYKNYFSEDAIMLITEIMRPMLEEYGYEPKCQ